MTYFLAFLEYIVVIGVVIFLLLHRVGIFAATPIEEINDLDETGKQLPDDSKEGLTDVQKDSDGLDKVSMQSGSSASKKRPSGLEDIGISSLEDLIDMSDDMDDISGIQLSEIMPDQSSDGSDLLSLALEKSKSNGMSSVGPSTARGASDAMRLQRPTRNRMR